MKVHRSTLAWALALAVTVSLAPPALAAPEGQVMLAVHVTLAPTWPMPANPWTPATRRP